MEFVEIGKILNTFGIKGELKVQVYTDFVEERFKKGTTIYISDQYLPFVMEKYRFHKSFLMITLKDHNDINLVEKYKNMMIYKSKEDIEPLDEGEYYFSDLESLEVYINDKKKGIVLRVEEGIRNNNLRILKDADHKEYLVPFLPVFVKKVDLQQKRIDLIDMEGLL